MQVSISVEGTDLANVLVNGIVPRNIFAAHLSRAILNIVASFGPWSEGYGFPLVSVHLSAPMVDSPVMDFSDHQLRGE